MKTFIAFALSAFSLVAFAQNKPLAAALSTSTYKVDTAATKIKWLGKKVTGQHEGMISVKSGTLTFSNDLITAGEIIVDMKSLTVTDIPATDEMNGKLVGHLTSADFFDVATYPEAKIVIKSSKKVAKGLEISGDLTMKGKTQPFSFVAEVKKADKDVTGKTQFNIDRTKWDIKYGSGSFFKSLGDKAINDEFTLTIELAAKL